MAGGPESKLELTFSAQQLCELTAGITPSTGSLGF
jgi:hypothetical protein